MGEVVGKKGSIVCDQTDTNRRQRQTYLEVVERPCFDPIIDSETKFRGALNNRRPVREFPKYSIALGFAGSSRMRYMI